MPEFYEITIYFLSRIQKIRALSDIYDNGISDNLYLVMLKN